MRFVFILAFAAFSFCRADQPPTGRWEGSIRIPEREQKIIVDLAQDQNGAWSGSVTLPGLDVKGAALSDIISKDSEIAFAIKTALGAQGSGAPTIKARLADGKLTGDFAQGGNTAPVVLVKAGRAQVEPLPHSTGVAKEMEGEWKGDFELMGYPRHVTVKLANKAPGATAQFLVVGKKTTDVPIDLVTLENDLLTLNSHQMGISYEGRWKKQNGEIQGMVSIGAIEQPLLLRRTN